MNWTDVLTGLKDVSPWILALIVVAFIITRYLKYREAKKNDLFLGSIDNRFQAHEAVCTKIQADVEQHMQAHEETSSQQLRVLEAIEQQLVALNSKQGPLTMRNQRLMIMYQWNWFRDEVAAIACNSIRKNGYTPQRAESIGRKVASAWKIAAREAQQSLERLEGVTYEYKKLFHGTFTTVLPRVWKWMVPIYEKGYASTLDIALDDLGIRIASLFEAEFNAYMTDQEDVDTGYIYRRTTSGEINASGMRDLMSSMGFFEEDSDDDMTPAHVPTPRPEDDG